MTLTIVYERLTVPQMFSKALEIFQHRYHTFLALSSMVTVPMMVFGVGISLYVFSALKDVMESVEKFEKDQKEMNPYVDPDANNELIASDLQAIANAVLNHLGFFVSILVFQTIVFSVLTIAGRGAMIRATAELYANPAAEPHWLQCFRLGLSRFCSLFCAGFLMSFGFVALYGIPMLLFYAGYVGLGVLTILVFPFVLFYCMVRFTLMFPAIVVEDLSAIQGLKRSWELSQGAFCDIFCVPDDLFFTVSPTFGLWRLSALRMR